jgi:hypothetical protein
MDFVPFELKNIIEYVPLCIIIVIILIATLTWNVLIEKIHYLITLIVMFIWAVYLFIGDSNSVWNWNNQQPPLNPGGPPLPPLPSYIITPPPARANPISTILTALASLAVIGVGLWLGFTSQNYDKNFDLKNGTLFTTIGSIITALSVLAGIYIIINVLRNNTNNTANAVVIPMGIIGLAVGIYLIVTGKNIDKNMKNGSPIDKSKTVNIDMQKLGLVGGLFFQITGVLVLLACMFFFKILDSNQAWAMLVRTILWIVLFIAGVLILTTPNISRGISKLLDLENNNIDSSIDSAKSIYVSHGAVYVILSFIAFILCIGGLRKMQTYAATGVFLLLSLIGLFIWNIVVSVNEHKNLESEYDLNEMKKQTNPRFTFYQQIREEAINNVKLQGRDTNVAGTIDLTNEVKDIMQTKVNNLIMKEKPNSIVNITISSISLVFVILMSIFRYLKYEITDVLRLPREFFNVFGHHAFPQAIAPPALSKSEYLTHDRIDNLTGNDWNDIISLHDDTAPNIPENFSKPVVNLAALSRWNMFLSAVLIILWVVAIYNYVTTSDKTEMWIATSFDVSMYSNVKDLLSAFFITILVGLSVAAVLLIPVVKEFNSEGVDNLLKFAESIQVWQWQEVTTRSGYLLGLLFASIIWFLLLWIPIQFNPDANAVWQTSGVNVGDWPSGFKLYFIMVTVFSWFFKSVLNTDKRIDYDFKSESAVITIIRSILTTLYLIPLTAWTFLKCIIWLLIVIFTFGQVDNCKESFAEELRKFGTIVTGINLNSNVDLRFFNNLFGNRAPTPQSVTTVVPVRPPMQVSNVPSNQAAITVDQTKVSVITKLIKSIIIIISCVMIVLTIIYGFYQLKQKAYTNTSTDGNSSTSSAQGLDPSTTTFIYVVLGLLTVAGIVAVIRDKTQKSGAEDPERLIFDNYHPEDESKPGRQLTFMMTHIIYVVLMIIVWVYDRDVDNDNKMSILGMAILGAVILLFHFCLEIIDTNDLTDRVGGSNIQNLFENIRFLVNVVFLTLICVLGYYKMHTLMIVLLVVMFLFHLSKSKIGLLILKLLWLCIIYIPCIILDAINSGRNILGTTTRPIWILLFVEIIIIALMFGIPYLINKAGTSESQIILAPVPLMLQNDTKLTTESKEIFIYHNTGTNRTAADNDANCSPEEKKRYNYSISGWFWINGSVTSKDQDLTIFDFAGVPKLTYNPYQANFKVTCKTVGTDGTIYDGSNVKVIYESHDNLVQNDEYKEFVMANELQITKQIPLQKWNYFVINYDGKTMDVFLNEELVGKSSFIIPYITVERLISGESTNGTGLNGNICNVIFSKTPMTTEQIRWTYNTLKTVEPPLIGTKTIADEVNNVGKTDIYSK